MIDPSVYFQVEEFASIISYIKSQEDFQITSELFQKSREDFEKSRELFKKR